MNGGARCWASLPADALAYIINEGGLCQNDVASIRLVCVYWRATTNSHLKSLAPACTSLEQVASIAQRFPFLTNCDLTRCDTRLVGHASLCRDASAHLSSLLAALSRMPSLTTLHISDTFSERMGQKHWASLVCAQALVDLAQPPGSPTSFEAPPAMLHMDAGGGEVSDGGAVAATTTSPVSVSTVASVGTALAAVTVGATHGSVGRTRVDLSMRPMAENVPLTPHSPGGSNSCGEVDGDADVDRAAGTSGEALQPTAEGPSGNAAAAGEAAVLTATADEAAVLTATAGEAAVLTTTAGEAAVLTATADEAAVLTATADEAAVLTATADEAAELGAEDSDAAEGSVRDAGPEGGGGSSGGGLASPPPPPPPPSAQQGHGLLLKDQVTDRLDARGAAQSERREMATVAPPPLFLNAAELADPGIKSFSRAISRPGATHQHAFWLPDWCGRLAGLQELHVRGRQRPSAGLPPCLLWLHAGRTAPQLTSLSLVRLSLVTLPEQLQYLTGLTRLVAQDCSLSLMPRGLASGLARLQYIDLSLNGLTALPADFTELTALKHLDLQRNKLVTLPADIGRLCHVTCLLLNNNQLRQLPPSMSAMRHVEVLSCSYNWLGGMGPSLPLLCNLPRLKKLELACVSDVRCRLVPPQELRFLAAHLTHLDLASNNLVPADVLGTLTSVRSLVLSDCGLLAVPPWVRRLAPSLHHLDLSNNSLSELPPWLAACTRLSYLSIAHNRLSLRVPPSVLEQMPQLEVVESE
ncbi:hypothetical protein Vafri_15427 [Volvox africanus]|uniref:Disease resistance R13L4/SHOC-2-like LRR domain-containing protein n=1 Tax=Volvox africanus TaxID=51714 RepID=A0A8J4BGY9_9CHLO|nr:hypothetical protein Vafri_15427 [Volvox africanus]